MAHDRTGLFARFRNRSSEPEAPDHVVGDDGAPGGDRAPDVASTPIVDLDDATFDAGTEDGWTVVDFWASWCRPCTTFHPMFVHAADHHDGPVRFARVDVEAAPRAASMVGVQSIPTVVLFDPGGNEVERLTGVPPMAELQRLIERGARASEAAS
jgi:thioredoxin